MPTLYHFSEQPGIERFEPRPPLADPGQRPFVWAVDAEHAWTYLFPRDCPRILMWPIATTSATDRERWFGSAATARLACIEWEWLQRLRLTRLYRYSMPPGPFVPHPEEDDAWMFVSTETVRPLAVEPVTGLLQALRQNAVELRLMPSLLPLRDAWSSSLHVSGIRLRNAKGWPPD